MTASREFWSPEFLCPGKLSSASCDLSPLAAFGANGCWVLSLGYVFVPKPGPLPSSMVHLPNSDVSLNPEPH